MNADEFNEAHPVGSAVVHDPAPLLGEPAETCTVDIAAFDRPDPEDGSKVLWTAVQLRRPSGEIIMARLESLVL